MKVVIKMLLLYLSLLGIGFSPMSAGGDFPKSEEVEPGDENMYLQIDASDEGRDIWQPSKSNGGYRYGPSMILNTDGSIDLWRASPGPGDIVDVINYCRLYDGGKSRTKEITALKPTSGTRDERWTCDPGVIKFGGYYYIGYTSTLDYRGTDNEVYVARSKNPDGPFLEKWTGSGWGDSPYPIVDFTENPDCFGAGEPSFVVVGDTLYIYYSWCNEKGAATYVATADANDENWPATMEFHGECIPPKPAGDSSDVKYSDEYGRFVAVYTEKRFTDDSYIAVWESFDGINFRQSGIVKTNTAKMLHNCGISGRADGHIGKGDPVYLSYAYGNDWGNWPTRIHEVKLSLAEAPETDPGSEQNADIAVTRKKDSLIPEICLIKGEKLQYKVSEGKSRQVWIMAFDSSGDVFPVLTGYSFDGYDESIIKIAGSRIYAVGKGSTRVYVHWHGYTGDFFVTTE